MAIFKKTVPKRVACQITGKRAVAQFNTDQPVHGMAYGIDLQNNVWRATMASNYLSIADGSEIVQHGSLDLVGLMLLFQWSGEKLLHVNGTKITCPSIATASSLIVQSAA